MAKVVVYRRFAYTAPTNSFTWTIVHNLILNYPLAVVTTPVVDVWILQNDGTYINSDAHEVTIQDANTIIITFNGTVPPLGGTACIT